MASSMFNVKDARTPAEKAMEQAVWDEECEQKAIIGRLAKQQGMLSPDTSGPLLALNPDGSLKEPDKS